MILGEVVARVWTDRQLDGLHGQRMVQIRDRDNQSSLVAVDLIGVSVGNRVLISTDEGAHDVMRGPTDAVVIALVAGVDEEDAQVAGATSEGART